MQHPGSPYDEMLCLCGRESEAFLGHYWHGEADGANLPYKSHEPLVIGVNLDIAYPLGPDVSANLEPIIASVTAYN